MVFTGIVTAASRSVNRGSAADGPNDARNDKILQLTREQILLSRFYKTRNVFHRRNAYETNRSDFPRSFARALFKGI